MAKTTRKKPTQKTAKKSAKKTTKKTVKKAVRRAAKKKAAAIPSGYTTITPFMHLRGSHDAIAFYQKAFGARIKSKMLGPDGGVMHAELIIGGAHIMMGEEMPQMGIKSPLTLGGTAGGVHLYVKDADKVFNSAVAAGATIDMPIAVQFWGDRYGRVVDPFGHRWSIATHVEDLTPKEMARRMDEMMKQMGAQ